MLFSVAVHLPSLPSCNYYSSSQFSDFCILSIYLAFRKKLVVFCSVLGGWDRSNRTDGREIYGKSSFAMAFGGEFRNYGFSLYFFFYEGLVVFNGMGVFTVFKGFRSLLLLSEELTFNLF